MHQRVMDELSVIEGAGADFDHARILSGAQTPVFFGSALTNFGLEPFLTGLVNLAPPPTARKTIDGEPIDPSSTDFSGFVFKIQANMDPNHRDRIAFMRLASGKLTRGIILTPCTSW